MHYAVLCHVVPICTMLFLCSIMLVLGLHIHHNAATCIQPQVRIILVTAVHSIAKC